MPKYEELRNNWPLRCASCDHVFRGKAMVTVYTVEPTGETTNVIMRYAVSRCPNCNSLMVGDVSERPGPPLP
jgi:DNA-directed RNA polymerase subunit RPC12/RpoP